MRPRDVFSLSFKNIVLGGRKNLLSIVAIAVGIFSLCFISGLGDAAAEDIRQRVSQIGLGGITIYPKTSEKYQITDDILNNIKARKEIRAATPFIYSAASLRCDHSKSEKTAVFGVDSDIDDVFSMELMYGSYFSMPQVASGEKSMIIDDTLAQKLYSRDNIIGKHLTMSIDGVSGDFVVSGIIRSQKKGLESLIQIDIPTIVYIPYTTLNEMTGHSSIDKVAVSCTNNSQENNIADSIIRELYFDTGEKFAYENLNEYISGFTEIVDIVKLFINTVASIALCVGCLGVMNSRYYSVESRRTEIGICMALGESRKSLLTRFLTESIIVCIVGGVIGIAMTQASVWMLNNIGINIDGIPKSSLIKSAAASITCGVICGILPAIKASSLEPVDVINNK